MENRAPASGGAAAEVRARHLRGLPWAGAVLVIVLVLVAAARLFAPGSADPPRDRGAQTVGQSTPPAQGAPEQTRAAQPALIIDAPRERQPAAPLDNPLGLIQPRPETGKADGASRTDDTANVSRASAAPAAAPRARAAVARPRASPPAPRAQADGGLLSTLLGIIHPDDAAGGHGSMDSLVAHVLAENQRTHTETSAALASLGQPETTAAESAEPTPARRELQSCPAANTVQGINCRDRICARWAGRDPACPAR